jgi:hypothetical protein
MPDQMNDVPPRLAVLEEIARSTKATLERIDRRLDTIEASQRSDFRWLLGIMLGGYVGLLGVMAHGFHWF